jgi:hypothetical protein
VRAVLQNLRGDARALRTLQAPEQVQFDPAINRWVVSPAAFKRGRDGTISVDLEEVQQADGLPLTHGYPRIGRAVGLVAHAVSRLREAEFVVSHVPIEGNDYHGQAEGAPSGAARRALAETCEIVVAIEGDVARRLRAERLARDAQKAIAEGAA